MKSRYGRHSLYKTQDIKWVLLFLLPAFVLLLVFMFIPILRNVQLSLSDYALKNNQATFQGFDNYRALFTESQGRFWKAYRNNILYAVITTPVIMLCGLVLAYMINNLRRGGVMFRTLYYLPVITSWIIVGLVFRYLFYSNDRGLVNYLLINILGIIDQPVRWLDFEWPGNITIWILGIWKNIGYAMIIYLAALQGIPAELYESAELDGAGERAKLFRITFPLIKPTTFFLLVQFLIGSFGVFLQVLILTGGDPRGATSTLQFLLYDRAFNKMDFGQGAAVGLITAVSVFILTIVLNRVFKRERYLY
jgi:multiple sugar transport system permease protein